MSNIRGLYFCYLTYQEENKLNPDSEKWCDLLKPYLGIDKEEEYKYVYCCPADKIGPCSYAMNENIPAEATDLPDDLVIFFEIAPGWNQTGGADDVITNRHGKPGANIAFADGSVKFIPAEEIPNLRWTINKSVERE